MKAKKLVCLILVLCIFGSLVGCTGLVPAEPTETPPAENPPKETPPAEMSAAVALLHLMQGDKTLENWHETNVVTRSSWQKLELQNEDAQKYPQLANAFEAMNAEAQTQAELQLLDLDAAATEMSGEEYDPRYLVAESTYCVQRADENLVSIVEYNYVYSGGVHPNHGWHGRNYDPKTGAEVSIADFLTDTEGLKEILVEKLTTEYSDVALDTLSQTLSYYAPEDFTWTADYQGMTFWFSPYDIAPYAAGTLTAKLWFDEYPELFHEKYTIAPESYAISLPMHQDTEFDLIPDDGKRDSVYVTTEMDQYGSYMMLSAVVNGRTFTDEINYAYDFQVYLVHMGDKNYIYSDSMSDNDYHMICVTDIDSMQQIEALYSMGFYGEYVEEGNADGTYYQEVFNDPGAFRLYSRFDVLGTRIGTASYKVNEETGRPEMLDPDFSVEDAYGITSKIPLTVQVQPDGGEREFAAGTTFYALSSDGETYIDMTADDGTEVRFYWDTSDYPWKVNGIPENDCFEMLLYAG